MRPRGVVAWGLGAAVAAVSAYAFLWGASWFFGDASGAVVRGVIGGPMVTTYPGVLLGGLPPVPDFDKRYPELAAMAVGIIGLTGLGVGATLLAARHRSA